MTGFRTLRRQLDDLGYYQPLVVDAVPLVEALVQDLLATTHNLKVCREEVSSRQSTKQTTTVISSRSPASCEQQPSFHFDSAKVTRLEAKVDDLDLLNKECHEVIRRQQLELEEKNKKILKMELNANKAKVVTQSERPLLLNKPKIEMTRLVAGGGGGGGASRQPTAAAPSSPSPSSSSTPPPPNLDVVAMYEKRNKQLDKETKRLRNDLNKAKELLSKAEKQWFQHKQMQNLDESKILEENSAKSAYMIKLLEDNNSMKHKIADIERHSRTCFHGKTIVGSHAGGGGNAHQQGPPPSFGVCCCGHAATCVGQCQPVRTCCRGNYCGHDIRSAVQASHAQLHEACTALQSGGGGHRQMASSCSGGGKKSGAAAAESQSEIGLTRESLKSALEENKALCKRVSELLEIRQKLKDKVQHLEQKQKILLKSKSNNSNSDQQVQELIGYIEAQRDVYKNNVERLLDNLDPDRRKTRLEDAAAAVVGIDDVIDTSDVIGERLPPSTKAPKSTRHDANDKIADRENKSRLANNVKRLDFSTEEVRRYSPTVNFPTEEVRYTPTAYRSSSINNNAENEETRLGGSTTEEPTRDVDGGSRRPPKTTTSQSAAAAKATTISSSQSAKASKEENNSHHVIYYEYQDEISKLRSELRACDQQRLDVEAKLTAENQSLKEQLAKLKGQLEKMEFEASMRQEKTRQKVVELRDDADSALDQFQRDLRSYQREVEELRSQLETKESHLLKLSGDKDALQDQLDTKTVKVEELKGQLKAATTDLGRSDAARSEHEVRIQSCVGELHQMQIRLRDGDREKAALTGRLEAEKSLSRELRIENMRLKDDALRSSSDTESKDTEIAELRADVQRYIREVKRIEELLAAKDKERNELLEQYKCLSDEMEKTESSARASGAKLARLKLELSTKTEELLATERRLVDMERDLIELSLTNEGYRTQIAGLNTKVDAAQSELRSTRTQLAASWAAADTAADLTDVHRLAAQLSAEKHDLQVQIADQAQEIEALNQEVRKLRSEVSDLTRQIDEEDEAAAKSRGGEEDEDQRRQRRRSQFAPPSPDGGGGGGSLERRDGRLEP